MPNHQPPVAAPVTNPCQPSPGLIANYPIGGGGVQCQPISADVFRNGNGAAVALTITFSLSPGLELNEDATLALVYIVNGSLDYSALFSQTEVRRNGSVTFKKGQTEVRFTILTLPLLPNTTFELEVIAYPASVGTIISGPVRAQADVAESPTTEAAEDKSLKALSVLATTALVTALGALAFALLGRSKD